jgi:hypothetical protein
MANRENDWAKQVPWPHETGPYEDYGWERGQSVLPQFRDPSLSRMPHEPERTDWQRRYFERENPRYSNQQGDIYSNLEWVDEEYIGMGPEYYQRPDKFIYEDVCDAMMMHGYLDARHIKVNVNDGQVILEGKVSSRQSKRLAEDLAFDIWGVKDVQNRLQIEDHNQGAGRVERVGRSGVYPASGPLPEDDAEVRSLGAWGDPGTTRKPGRSSRKNR